MTFGTWGVDGIWRATGVGGSLLVSETGWVTGLAGVENLLAVGPEVTVGSVVVLAEGHSA